MPPTNFPPLYDSELNRILELTGLSHIHVPIELKRKYDGATIKVWLTYVEIAQGYGGAEIELPPIEELARMCGCTRRKMYQAEQELQAGGWLIIRHMKDKHNRIARRHAIVKYDEMVIASKRMIVELIQNARVYAQRAGDAVGTTLHNAYLPDSPQNDLVSPPRLAIDPAGMLLPTPLADQQPRLPVNIRSRIQSLRLRHEKGYMVGFNDPSDLHILDLCRQASIQDIAIALDKLAAMRAPIKTTVDALFRRMFQLNREGIGVIKARWREDQTTLVDNVREHQETLVNLARGESVEWGKLYPPHFSYLDDCRAIERHPDGVHVKLRPRFNIVKLAAKKSWHWALRINEGPGPGEELVRDLTKQFTIIGNAGKTP